MDWWFSPITQTALLVLAIVAVPAIIVFAVKQTRRQSARKREEELEFVERYGSVDRMLTEADIDRDKLRAIRDADRSGPIKATQLVRETLGVPLKPAVEFVKRL